MTHQCRKHTIFSFLSYLVFGFVTQKMVGYSCTMPIRINSFSSIRLPEIAYPCLRFGWHMIKEWLSLVLLHQLVVSCSQSVMSLGITSPSRHVVLMLKSGKHLCSRIDYRETSTLSSRLSSPVVSSTASQTPDAYRSSTHLCILGMFFLGDLLNVLEATDVS